MRQLIDIVWLAGLLEGEGCFGLYKTPTIRVGMTDFDVIEKVRTIFDVTSAISISSNENSTIPSKVPVFQTMIYGKNAIELMKEVLPYMGQRRTQKILEIISEYETKMEYKKNFCKRGHDLNVSENVRYKENGYRVCKLCDKVLYEMKREA